MNENTGQFRSAAFGGFHRQDVLDYLERMPFALCIKENRLCDRLLFWAVPFERKNYVYQD